jgi:hypothetical protein
MSTYTLAGSISESNGEYIVSTTDNYYNNSYTYSFNLPNFSNFYNNSIGCGTNTSSGTNATSVSGSLNYIYNNQTYTITNSFLNFTYNATSSCPHTCSIINQNTNLQTNLYNYSKYCDTQEQSNDYANFTSNYLPLNSIQNYQLQITTYLPILPPPAICDYQNSTLYKPTNDGTYQTTYYFTNYYNSYPITINLYNYYTSSNSEFNITGFTIELTAGSQFTNGEMFSCIALLSNMCLGCGYQLYLNNTPYQNSLQNTALVIGGLSPLIQIYSTL